jgi:hypothetical protein
MQGVRIRNAKPAEPERVGQVRAAAYLADGFLSVASADATRLRALAVAPRMLAAAGSAECSSALSRTMPARDGSRILCWRADRSW